MQSLSVQEWRIFESINKRLIKFAAYVTNCRLIRLPRLTGLENILQNHRVVKLRLLVCLETFFFHLSIKMKELMRLDKGSILPPFLHVEQFYWCQETQLGPSTALNQKCRRMIVCVQTYLKQWKMASEIYV